MLGCNKIKIKRKGILASGRGFTVNFKHLAVLAQYSGKSFNLSPSVSLSVREG